ncbi:MAG: rRNA pseudouridine synthase [Clostridia bacterium]|jgi:16S rRNA pseudouridine516 synthase|nr:rRNA pseudouridine synthase [Clostridia bacterium]
MRLDKLLSECGLATRSEASRAARAGKIQVNGIPALKPDWKVDPEKDEIVYCGERVLYQKFLYLMLNKPDGYVSATEDGKDPTVTELFPEEYRRQGIFPCGRLDKHTLGLMLLTNDGVLSHRLLAPKSHVAKTYAFSVKFPLSNADISALEAGVDIGGYVTKPCKVSLSNPKAGQITIVEGKYHQIKLMMQAVHNQITSLERISFGPLTLDPSLTRGTWRPLSQEEIEALRREAHTVEKNP